ncbi:MAG TPA: HAMP domain-containing sensor histidine kinase [Marmoricola sp.]|nr:HAMP domain-containing sensor histidine kinase [Marmoricola sp.]
MKFEPKDMAAAIDDASELFRALWDRSDLAVGVVDRTGRLTMMSRGLKALIGPAAHGATTSELPALSHLYDAAGTTLLRPEQLALSRAAGGEMVRDVVMSVRRPGAPVRYLRTNAMPLVGPNGENNGAFVLASDITAEHEALSRQDAIRGLLLDTVNHELRTPLTVVLANAELIIDAADELPEHLRTPLLAIARASDRLRDTVQHVSDLVDLEAVTHASRSETSIRELVGAVVERHRELAKAHHVTIVLDCPRTVHWNLDGALLTRAVSALLLNALTHGPDDDEVTIGIAVLDDLLHIRVADHGAGIPAEDQERLTKPFERGSTSALDSRHGRGLGLAFAHAVATSHHGALVLSNREPRGFTACLILA